MPLGLACIWHSAPPSKTPMQGPAPLHNKSPLGKLIQETSMDMQSAVRGSEKKLQKAHAQLV